ncbi:MAG: MFS transporter, partial [Chloroflexi bacterium]|nr:MFS transporter [Chloroflexota bacterium]
MSVLAAYRQVLSNRHLARLMFGEFVSSIGDWLYLVALLIVIYERADDPVVLGIVGAARVLPYVVLSVPAGIAADRFDRRMILLVTDLARGAVMLVMAAVVVVGGPVEAIVALAIVATCFSAFFSPAIGAYIPSLVRDESELAPANSVWSTLDNLAFVVGPAVAGLLIGVGGLAVAFVLNAISFAVVAAVLWRLPPSRAGAGIPAADREAPSGESGDNRPAGLRQRLRPVAAPLVGLGIMAVAGSFVGGGLGVLTVVIAVDVLAAGETGTGLLNAAFGAGGLVGAIVSGVLVLRRRLGPPLILGGVVTGVSVAFLGQTELLVAALIAMAVAAAGGLLVDIVSTTLFQRVVPDEMRGRVIGGMETLAVAAYAAGSFVLPVAAAWLGIGPVLVGAGIAVAASVFVAIPLLGPHAVQLPPADDIREHILRVPVFAGLPPARLEAAMARAHVVRVEAGETIIGEGDPPDRFYVIADGTVRVTQRADGEESFLRRMGVDEVFGEIGLL